MFIQDFKTHIQAFFLSTTQTINTQVLLLFFKKVSQMAIVWVVVLCTSNMGVCDEVVHPVSSCFLQGREWAWCHLLEASSRWSQARKWVSDKC